MTWNNNNNNDWTNKAEQFANDVIGADNDTLGLFNFHLEIITLQ